MKQAFVLQLGSETDASKRHFEGHIEEIDTGRELRFKSTEDLLAFLAQCFDQVKQRQKDRDGPLRE